MKRIHLPGNHWKTTIEIPSGWDELSNAQFIHIAKNLKRARFMGRSVFGAADHSLSSLSAFDEILQSLRIEFLSILLGVRSYFLMSFTKKGRAFLGLYPDEIQELCQHTNFLFQENQRTVNPLPKFRRWCRVYHGPSDRLANITAGEFHFADLFFQEWMDTESETALNKLVAVLYRPKGKGFLHDPDSDFFSGDIRIPFNQNSIEARAKRLAGISRTKKLAIAHFYEGCRNVIIEAYPEIFKKTGKGSGSSEGWIPVFRSLSKDIHYERIAEMRLGRVLYEMVESQKEAQKLKRIMKSK
ncbi:MAG: hypothetical protein LPK80_06080 [Bacteroidota bacterium]|nr:hypothetical protein [Bacteroidota bacterium]